ncbi:MAG: hypothetical protein QF690_05475, partial [Anaerolineales bacterium]|nr:hypothetical protein [Anaerolineales bacterium]
MIQPSVATAASLLACAIPGAMAGVTRFSWSYQAPDCTRMEQAQISTGIETSMLHWVSFAQESEAL